MSEQRVVRQYDGEVKLDAVRLVEQQGYSLPEAAQRLGIPKSNLSNWRRHFLRSSRGALNASIPEGAADA